MEQLIELLRQIEELAGVAIDALEGATQGGGGEGGGEGGGQPPAPEGAPPAEGEAMPPRG
jgi:hypothetical protein